MQDDLKPVVLINPRPGYAGSVAQKVFPPVGLMYLAAALKAAGQPVRLIDANAANLDDAGVVRLLRQMNPFAVGMPVFADVLPATAALVRAIRAECRETRLIAGGPEASVDPKRLAAWIPEIDHILCGEAEETLVELVQALRAGTGLPAITGLYTPATDGDLNPREIVPARVHDLERIAIPDRESIQENYDRRAYYTILVPDRHLDCMVTSRGCPHRCTFCYNWRHRLTYRSTDSCLDEIDRLFARGIRTIEILDDNFTADRDRAVEMFNRIARERWPLKFRIKARADGIDEALMMLARRAGVYQISIGAESGSPAILGAMRKRITPELTVQAIQAVMKLGIFCHANFIVGFPGETPETMEMTVRLIERAGPTSAGLDILTPYQGTAVYDQARAEGTLVGDWSPDPAAEQPWVRLPWTRSRRDLEEARKSMLFRIYWNRRYMARYARMIIGGINPTMGRYLVQEAGITWPGIRGLAGRMLKK